jgi:hypothetical protein
MSDSEVQIQPVAAHLFAVAPGCFGAVRRFLSLWTEFSEDELGSAPGAPTEDIFNAVRAVDSLERRLVGFDPAAAAMRARNELDVALEPIIDILANANQYWLWSPHHRRSAGMSGAAGQDRWAKLQVALAAHLAVFDLATAMAGFNHFVWLPPAEFVALVYGMIAEVMSLFRDDVYDGRRVDKLKMPLFFTVMATVDAVHRRICLSSNDRRVAAMAEAVTTLLPAIGVALEHFHIRANGVDGPRGKLRMEYVRRAVDVQLAGHEYIARCRSV